MKVYVKPVAADDPALAEVVIANDNRTLSSPYCQVNPVSLDSPTTIRIQHGTNSVVRLPLADLIKKLHNLIITDPTGTTTELAFKTGVDPDADDRAETNSEIPLALIRANTVVNLSRL